MPSFFNFGAITYEQPALALIAIVVMTFFLSAVKAIPQYEFMSSFPRKTEAVEYHSVELLGKSIFSRNQRVVTQTEDFYLKAGETKEEYNKTFWSGARPWGWHEYGAFTGVAAFVLFASSVISIRRSWPWILISIGALLMSLGEFSPVDIWSVLHRLPVVGSLHGSSRLVPLFIFAFAVAAGFALSLFWWLRSSYSPCDYCRGCSWGRMHRPLCSSSLRLLTACT